MTNKKLECGFKEIQYKNGKPVPSVIFGDGSIRVTTTHQDSDGFTGVAFSHEPNNKTIGTIIDTEHEGMPFNEAFDIEYHLLFDNPKSIDVVIAKLLEAKDLLK